MDFSGLTALLNTIRTEIRFDGDEEGHPAAARAFALPPSTTASNDNAWWKQDQQPGSLTVRNILGSSNRASAPALSAAKRYADDGRMNPLPSSSPADAASRPSAHQSISTASWALRSPTSRKLLEMAERLAVEDFHSANSAAQHDSPTLLPAQSSRRADTYMTRSPTVVGAWGSAAGAAAASQNLLHTLDRAAAQVESLVPDATAFFPHLMPAKAQEGQQQTQHTGHNAVQGQRGLGETVEVSSESSVPHGSPHASLAAYASVPARAQAARPPAGPTKVELGTFLPKSALQHASQQVQEAADMYTVQHSLRDYGVQPASRRASAVATPPPPPVPASPAAPLSESGTDSGQRIENKEQPPNSVLISKLASALTALQDAARQNERLRAQLKEAEARAGAGGAGGSGSKGQGKPPVKGAKALQVKKQGSDEPDVALLADAVARVLQERGLVGGPSSAEHRSAAGQEDRATVMTGATGEVSYTATEYKSRAANSTGVTAAGSNRRPPSASASHHMPTRGSRAAVESGTGDGQPPAQEKKPRPPRQVSAAGSHGARARSTSVGRASFGFGSSAPSLRTLQPALKDGVVRPGEEGEGGPKPRGPLSPSGQRISSVTASRLATRSLSPLKPNGPVAASLSTATSHHGEHVQRSSRGRLLPDDQEDGAEAGAAGAVVALPSPPSSRGVTSPASSLKGGSGLAPNVLHGGAVHAGTHAARSAPASQGASGTNGQRTSHAYSDFVREDDEGGSGRGPAAAPEVPISPDGVLHQYHSMAESGLPPSLAGPTPASIAASILSKGRKPAVDVFHPSESAVHPPLQDFGYHTLGVGGHTVRLPSRPLLAMSDRRESADQRNAMVDSMLENYRRELGRWPSAPSSGTTPGHSLGQEPTFLQAAAPGVTNRPIASLLPHTAHMQQYSAPRSLVQLTEAIATDDDKEDFDRIGRIAKLASAMKPQAEQAPADVGPAVAALREEWRKALVSASGPAKPVKSTTAALPAHIRPGTATSSGRSQVAAPNKAATSSTAQQAPSVASRGRGGAESRTRRPPAPSTSASDRDARALQALAGMTARVVDKEEAQRQATADRLAATDSQSAGREALSRGRALSASSAATSEAWLKYYGPARAAVPPGTVSQRVQDTAMHSGEGASASKSSRASHLRQPSTSARHVQLEGGSGATGFSASAMASALDGENDDDVGQLLAAATAAVGLRMHKGASAPVRSAPPPPSLAAPPSPPPLPLHSSHEGSSRQAGRGVPDTRDVSLPMDFRSKLLAASFTASPRPRAVPSRAGTKLATSVTSPTPEASVVGLSAKESSMLGLADERMAGAEVLSQSMRRIERSFEDPSMLHM